MANIYVPIGSAAQCGEYLSFVSLKAIETKQLEKVLGGFLLSYAAVPIAIATTPVWIVADVVIAIAEACIVGCKGGSAKEAGELLYNKMLVSPIQQTVSGTVQLVTLIVFPHFLIIAYPFSQAAVRALPKAINPSQYNIFINGGIKPKRSSHLDNDIEKAIAYINENKTPNAPKPYDDFRQKILNRASAPEILGFAKGQSFTDQEVIRNCRKLSLIIHPDKNPERKEESEHLFNCLTEASKQLQTPR
jgi:hypothetical protein